MRRILVTGSRGFVGSRLVPMLRRDGFEVRGLDILPGSEMSGSVLEVEVCRRAVDGMDAVLHLATEGPGGEGIFAGNLRGVQCLAAAAREAGARRFLFASTINVYGQGVFKKSQDVFTPAYLPIDEGIPTVPEDDYSRSKLAGEEALADLSASGRFETFSVRLPAIWTATQVQAFRPHPTSSPFSPLCVIDPWHYIDLRDVHRALQAYLRAAIVPASAAVYLCAPDLTCYETTEQILSRDCPEWLSLWASPPQGHQPLFSSALAEKLIGWQPRFSWRDVPALAALLAKVSEYVRPSRGRPTLLAHRLGRIRRL